jgi:uncharacterized Fe-S center protein
MADQADVYLARARSKPHLDLTAKTARLVERAGLGFVHSGDLVAVKLHFGEAGNVYYLRPTLVAAVVTSIRAKGGRPFLTDTNTLYRQRRSNAVDHLTLAVEHGFGLAQVGAPVLIADGLRSHDCVEIEIGLKHFNTVRVASATYHCDALVVLSHFTGHLATGFGATLKSISMGLGGRAAKQMMHGIVRPQFKSEDACTGCGTCVEVCPAPGAVVVEGGKARFDHEKCWGCAECIIHCPTGALQTLWNEAPERMGEKMAEVAYAVLRRHRGRCLFVNFLLDMSSDCDCLSWADTPFVPDVGIVASHDPVAVDQASADLVNAAEGIADSALKAGQAAGEDKFRGLRPSIDWTRQLEYAEEIGLGTRRYSLHEL